jgi:hypothetical protein
MKYPPTTVQAVTTLIAMGALPAGSLLRVAKSDDAVGRFLSHTRLLMTPEISINSTASGSMCKGLPAAPPVDTDGDEKQYKA